MRPLGQRTRSNISYGKRVAFLRYLPSGLMLQLEAPYDKDFTDSLKKSITTKKRIWDDNDKCWYIANDQFDKLCHLLDGAYDETILLDFPSYEVSATAWGTLYLLPGAPLEVVRAVFKVLAMKYHPDRGGDEHIMQRLNSAYKEILGELKNGD